MNTSPAADLINALSNEYWLLSPVLKATEDGIEGNTYIVSDSKQKYVAKLYDDDQRAKVLAHFQHHLHVAGLPVPAIVMTKLGGYTAKLANFSMVLSEFVNGDSIGWDKGTSLLPRSLTIDITSVVAKMHVISQTLDSEIKLSHALDVSQIVRNLSDSLYVKSLGPDLVHARRTMIHGDLARENILLTEARDSVKAVIDFGDAHYDYITYDIAVVLTQVYVTKTWGIDHQGIEDFLAAYNQHNPLRANERRTILPFMILRNQALLQEIELKLAEKTAEHETLESIKRSLQAKLRLLEQDSRSLEALFLNG